MSSTTAATAASNLVFTIDGMGAELPPGIVDPPSAESLVITINALSAAAANAAVDVKAATPLPNVTAAERLTGAQKVSEVGAKMAAHAKQIADVGAHAKEKDAVVHNLKPMSSYPRWLAQSNMFAIDWSEVKLAFDADLIRGGCAVCAAVTSERHQPAYRCAGPGASPLAKCAEKKWAHLACLVKAGLRKADADPVEDYVCVKCKAIETPQEDAKWLWHVLKARGVTPDMVALDGPTVFTDAHSGLHYVLAHNQESKTETMASLALATASEPKKRKPSAAARRMKRAAARVQNKPPGGPVR